MDNNIEIMDKMHEANVYRKEQEYDVAMEKYMELYQTIKRNKQYYSQYGCDILKQLCFCYRKKGNIGAAIESINEAIKLANKNSLRYGSNDTARENLAICYMNKGVIFDERGTYDEAIENYNMGVTIFRELVAHNDAKVNLLINALLNLGTSYYNNKDYNTAEHIFIELLNSLGETKEEDSRGIYAIEYLEKIQGIKGERT